ncbi:beta-galactosidase [Gracilibacillus dipsosauri]|uniref:Glycoside hydrolase family 42 N-terminal domain-containing protein n=1 Tax=Gracilibacillus dipsosauri TaxID=178340 RepID=A0A317L183_9BACI|nr:beta-galactosidase [Gracilibacillus dipsosauri]PWU69587.1 hypothetical protein DLJ74_06355 [Gracilibacillus dipsosauri]
MQFLKEHVINLSNKTVVDYMDDVSLSIATSCNGGGFQLDLTAISKHAFLQNEYFVADVFHESEDVLVIICRFEERSGRFVQIHFGILPHVLTTICLPLSALNGEKLFLERYPNVMQTVLRGDPVVDLEYIDSVYIETPSSRFSRKFMISNIELLTNEPECQVKEMKYIDEMGQNNFREWLGRIGSTLQLKARLIQAYEEAKVRQRPFFFDGERKFASNGFFRTDYDGTNWWLISPEGDPFFSIGVNCVRPNSPMKIKGMENLLPSLPIGDNRFTEAFDEEAFDFHIANLIRAFGEDWNNKWMFLTNERLKQWKFNTIGNWSDDHFISFSELPYVFQMRDFPETSLKIYRDFPDVFDPAYQDNARKFARQLEEIRDDRRVVGYFMRNEPHWAFINKLNLVELMINQRETSFCKRAFVDYLAKRYVEIGRLNEAWQTNLTSFEDLFSSESFKLPKSVIEGEDFVFFQKVMIRRYIEIPLTCCKEVDPNHLNMGIRYAWISSESLLEGCELFDVFSINCYQDKPNKGQITSISKKLKIPVIIGEFHFGGADVGLPAYGIKATENQLERGKAYRYYVEQAASVPGLIGVHYFQYNDQPVLGRFDGENYQIGLVDVAQQPYEDFMKELTISHENVYEVRARSKKPYSVVPRFIAKTGF